MMVASRFIALRPALARLVALLVALLARGCRADVDACGLAAPPTLAANQTVGLVRIQKTGSTTLAHLWDLQIRRGDRKVWNEWSHLNHHDWSKLKAPARVHGELLPKKEVVVLNLRDPVERVLSEYYFCSERLNCVQQTQWDYSHRTSKNVSALFRRMRQHVFGEAPLGLLEWLRWPENPAHERQAHYVSGYRYGRSANVSRVSLDGAAARLCDAGVVVLLSADLPAASLALARAELGWEVTADEWAKHRAPGSIHFDAAPKHLAAFPEREAVDDDLRAEIRARNPRDAALYDRARRIVETRAAMLPGG